ncbi:MAG: hypothetical protein IPK82_05400 [Polyangiaceae bacterium]|nr:hypothetical protein [Polyangiaceae bacterium]
MAPRTAKERRARNKKITLIGWSAAVCLGFAMLIPNAFVCVGTRNASACFKSYEAPRGPELPWCGDAMGWFTFPSRAPWTHHHATYRAEELRIRIAMGQYENAVIGQPNRTARELAAKRVEEAETIIKTGSQRLAFEELGPAIGAPDPAQDALLAGDRDTLLRRAKEWGEWHKRLHTLQSALIEGDFPKALDIAKHYATYDPREEDLRSALGGILCLGGETKRAIELLELQQNDRASRRYAAMSRGWGDVRTAIVACAALGNVTPPPRPASSEAGQDDRREARASLRLRAEAAHDHRFADAQQNAEQLLSNALPEGARAPIFAALIASGYKAPPDKLVELCRAHAEDGEPPLLDLGSVNVLSWMDVPSARPIVTGPVFRKAGESLVEIAKSLEPIDIGKPALFTAAGAMFIEGARAFVRAADTENAVAMLNAAWEITRTDDATRALAEGIARYASGDALGARDVLFRVSIESVPTELRAAVLTLRAEVSGKDTRPLRDEAKKAYDVAKQSRSAALIAWARRVRFWAAPDTEPPAPGSVSTLDPMAGRFTLWPNLGYSNRTVTWKAEDDTRLEILGKNLSIWSAARFASDNDKRAYRYAFMRHRGDMPDALVPYLSVASEIAGDGGDPEVWLDAVMATDAPRFSMRVYTWARAQTARFRGDTKNFTLWNDRFKTLAKFAGDPDRAELARFLGI